MDMFIANRALRYIPLQYIRWISVFRHVPSRVLVPVYSQLPRSMYSHQKGQHLEGVTAMKSTIDPTHATLKFVDSPSVVVWRYLCLSRICHRTVLSLPPPMLPFTIPEQAGVSYFQCLQRAVLSRAIGDDVQLFRASRP